jgi:hypothetical protein
LKIFAIAKIFKLESYKYIKMHREKNKINKNKSTAQMIMEALIIGGVFIVASTSPSFGKNVLPKLIKWAYRDQKKYWKNKAYEKKLYHSFYYLLNAGFVESTYKGNQLHISLTKEGRKKVGKYNIDNLKIKKPKKWDKKWRILVFDILDIHKTKREAIRGKLKEWNLYQLQKSVWVCPYQFQNEVEILRNFFFLNKKEMQIIIASEIEYDTEVRKHFKI